MCFLKHKNKYDLTFFEYCLINNHTINKNLIKVCYKILNYNYKSKDFFRYCKEGNLQAVYCIGLREG